MSPSPNSASICQAAREAAVLFEMDSRGSFEVTGSERVRWLDGMISGDVSRLEESGVGSGCYATLLTNRGKIVADLHVGNLGELFVVETLRGEIPRILETLERFIIADDVTLRDVSSEFETLGLEGPKAGEILSRALSGSGASLPETEGWTEAELSGVKIRIGAFGFSGELAYQLAGPKGSGADVAAALEAAGEESGLRRGDAQALSVLRIEAGIPGLGSELTDSRLPPEARLERAIATNKGCYVGQEIVARLRARGQVNHLMVGLAVEGDAVFGVDTVLSVDGRKIGEVTSSASSPQFGRIALGYVRREHAEPGTVVQFDGGQARVAALPFYASPEIASPPQGAS